MYLFIFCFWIDTYLKLLIIDDIIYYLFHRSNLNFLLCLLKKTSKNLVYNFYKCSVNKKFVNLWLVYKICKVRACPDVGRSAAAPLSADAKMQDSWDVGGNDKVHWNPRSVLWVLRTKVSLITNHSAVFWFVCFWTVFRGAYIIKFVKPICIDDIVLLSMRSHI